jgi:hypothetical protein
VKRVLRLLLAACVLALLGMIAAALLLQQRGITPRALAPYIAKRTSGHNGAIVGAGAWSVDALLRLDRGAAAPRPAALPGVGAGSLPPAPSDAGQLRLVATSDAVRAAIAAAAPGDVITLQPGRYRFSQAPLNVTRGGTEQANIVLRAARAGTVEIELELVEGFHVSAPNWRFENLVIRGVCRQQGVCEHAFHVSGGATGFAALNNTIVDFNAHFKINGERGAFPDRGRIEGNTLRNDSARATHNPVTPIDLVAASGWIIRRNLIADFVKAGGDRISYGGFAKGGGSANLFEQNAVLCEARLQGAPGQRVGLSLGGGATGKSFCRDGKCITEQDQSILRANLIAGCSDDGIYLNNAAASKVVHNTLLDTGGIQVRFAGSSADIEGNLVDGDIRGRDGALLRLNDNRSTPIALLYAGWHAQRALFADAQALDLRWRGEAPRRAPLDATVPDLCGAARPAAPAYGAFEDIARCGPP